MPPEPRIVRLEAPCLRASRQNVRLATVKPAGHLAKSPTLGPHYRDIDRELAVARANAFLGLVAEQDAELAVAPEYFTPREALEGIIRNSDALREGTLFILPLESMDRTAHDEVLALGQASDWEIVDAEMEDNRAGTSLNSCAVIYRTPQDRPQLFLQHKIYPSPLEENILIAGKEFFVFEGAHIGLIVLICSDGNHRAYHQIWADAAARKAGLVMAHVQWNPSSDYPEYRSLWASILGAEQGERRLIISCNWTDGSVIEGANGRGTISRFRTRFFRRRSHLDPSPFEEHSRCGMHVEHYAQGKETWEIWHSLSKAEHAMVLDVIRPYENVPNPELSRGPAISRVQYFELNGQNQPFRESAPQGLASPFWDLMCELGVDQAQRRELEGLTLHDVEVVCNSGLIRQGNSWYSKDVTQRLPTAPILCPVRECNRCAENRTACGQRRPEWLEEAQDFAECLQEFWNSEVRTTRQIQLRNFSEYPLNLDSHDGVTTGWLFHAKGKHGARLARDLAALLMNRLRDDRRSILLCGVGVGGPMPNDLEIFDRYLKVDEPETGQGDILEPEGYARLEIINLRQ